MIRLRRHYKVRNAKAGRQRLLFLGIILREESKVVNTGGKHGVKWVLLCSMGNIITYLFIDETDSVLGGMKGITDEYV